VKLADDRSGDVIVRLYEAHGRPGAARVRTSFAAVGFARVDLLERRCPEPDGPELRLRPFEIVTLRISR
jgi:alpha-mannosidase